MPDEDPKERVDRELIELLNELRVALPGVQVLFAFLLTIPFSRGFERVTGVERDVYFAGFLCATLSSLLLITPSAYHRLRFREPDKERLIEVANRLAIAGLGVLALAMGCVVFVIGDVVFGRALGIGVAAGVLTASAGFWYLLPLSERRRVGDEPRQQPG